MTVKDLQLVGLIEKLALHTWPAQTQESLDGWLFRASEGFTKRGNSVWTSTGTMPDDPDWFSKAASFYQSKGLPLRFHISDATANELASLLINTGFRKETPCSVMVAHTDQVLELTRNMQPLFTCKLQTEHDALWLSHFWEMEGHGSEARKQSFYDRLFKEIAQAKCFITLYSGNVAVAVGTSVAENGWAGFINLVVHPLYRGRGIGKELVYQLTVWSAEQGATGLYLQVVDDNEPACRLYRKAGFAPLYTYHYLCEPDAG